jgi:DeoR/GlpR family transcriptional regulator of sugar metabolism
MMIQGRSPGPVERRELIAERLRVAGSVTVAALEAEFHVSSMTARRDLRALERDGRARRTHGGAVAPGTASQEGSFPSRLREAAPSRERLGDAACDLVADGEAVFVDSSTIAYLALGGLLATGRRMTVLTNSVPVMELVARSEGSQTTLIGLAGSLRKTTRSFVGPRTIDAIRGHFADKLLLGATGMAGGALMEPDPLEAEVKRAMARRSHETVLLIDGSRLERAGLGKVAELDAIGTALVVDASAEQLAPLRAAGVRIEEVR